MQMYSDGPGPSPLWATPAHLGLTHAPSQHLPQYQVIHAPNIANGNPN